MILGAGAGFPTLPDYTAFGDRGDPKRRAAQLDEALEVLAQLWSGNPVKHHGIYYQVECGGFQPTLQRPRVPVWVGAAWPAKKPLARAARWDGVVPTGGSTGLEVEPEDLRRIVSYTRGRRDADAAFDVIRFGKTRSARDTKSVAACADAGATWWIEYVFPWDSSLEATHARIREGPPRP